MTVTTKQIYLTMDNYNGLTKDKKIANNIITKLVNAGFNAKLSPYGWHGSNTHNTTQIKLGNNKATNTIVLAVFNGSDSEVILESVKKVNGGRYAQTLHPAFHNGTGNVLVLSYFYKSLNFVDSDGGKNPFYSWLPKPPDAGSSYKSGIAYPANCIAKESSTKLIFRGLNAGSNGGNHLWHNISGKGGVGLTGDLTGDLIASDFIKMFTTTSPTPTPDPTPKPTPTPTNKKIGEYTVQTDENGVFSQQLVLPEIGLYEADLTYPGSTYYENSSTSIKITYNGSSTIVTPTDPITPVTPVTPVTPPSGTYNPDTTTIVPLVDGKPDVTKFTNMSFADTTKTYTLTKDQFVAAFKRDMCSIYFNNALPKYVYFQQSTNSNYYVVSREHWNTLCHQMNHKLLMRQGTRNLGTSNYKNYIEAYPDTFTVNFNDTQYNYPLVRDRQNWSNSNNGSCGPTSLSMCTQMLYTYYSEPDLRQEMGCWKTDTSPSQISNWINKSDNAIKCGSWIQGKSTSSWDKVKTALSNHYPVIMHIYGHYVCLFDVSADGTKVALANPSSTGYPSGLALTKWNNISTLNSNLNILEFLIIMPDIGAYDNTTYKSIYNAYLSNYGGKWTPSSDTLNIIDDSGLYSGDLGA